MIECPWDGLKVEEEIGEGAFGTVYRVVSGDDIFAMKYVRIPQSEKESQACALRLGGQAEAKEYYRGAAEKLMEETRILQRLKDHPNIVRIRDFKMLERETAFEIFILMEHLQSLPEYMTRHMIDEKTAARLGMDICSALTACAKESIIHRDLKPDNILVDADGRFKICDFGVAKILEKTFTENSVRGTFSYMAPEVYHGEKYNHRADIYSLGMIMYCMVNRGRDPFMPTDQRMIRYNDKEEAMNRRMNGEAIPAPVDASEAFAQILLKACAYYPERRYASAEDLQKDLSKLLDGSYKKKIKSVNYGKRTKAFYLKAAAILLLAVLALAACSKPMMYIYRENFVDLCDKDIKAALLEDYGITSGARLTGNGTLYIESDNDFYCTKGIGAYPWMNHKQDIKKIVFGEDVTKLCLYDFEYEFGITDGYNDSSSDHYVSFADEDNLCPPNEKIFSLCTNLTEVVINSSTFEIADPDPFAGDIALSSITCPADADISVEVGALADTPWINEEGYRILGTTLVRYNGQEEVLDDIPENVRKLSNNCFRGGERIKRIILPEALTCIETGAFRLCDGIEELEIPENVTFIGEGVLSDCQNLKTLTVLPGNKAYVMENGVLYDTDKRTLLWCSPEFKGVFEIPETVETVFFGALDHCTSMTGLVIPDILKTHGLPFPGLAPKLYSIDISESNPVFTSEDGLIYDKEKTQLLFCPRNQEGEMAVPAGIISIGDYALACCSDITEIRLPDTLDMIMPGAFEKCTGLESIVLPGKLSYIGQDAFTGCDRLTDIYYEGTEEDWQVIMSRQPRGIGIDEEKTAVHFSE